MDFAFSEEQEMLRSSAREYLAARFPPEQVATLADGDGWDPLSWKEMADLGWVGLSAPEDAGGAGMGFLEEVVVLEELGRALYPGPYFSGVVLAAPCLADSPDLLKRFAAGETTATLAWAEPEGPSLLTDVDQIAASAKRAEGGWRLDGDKDLVPDLAAADVIVVAARSADGVGLWAVAADEEGVEVRTLETVDSTRRFGRLSLRGARGTEIVPADGALEVLARVRIRALAAAAVEAAGVASSAVEMMREHASTRQQFDRPIGAYQAVSHQVVDAYMDTELARSLAYWAAWAVATGDEQAPLAAAAAKAFATDAAVRACERAIQVHGGIGFTWEHILHRLYKRAEWLEAFEGHGPAQRAEIADLLLADSIR